MATSPVTVEGERNLVITAEVNNSVVINGDGNTVHMHQSPDGALLAHEYRWTRPRTRLRGDQPAPPPRFDLHVDREDEVQSLVGDGATPRVVNLHGAAGIGKTYALVATINHADAALRDGTIYLDARGRDADDVLHAIFGELYDSPVPIRDARIGRHLAKREALVAVEDADLAADGGQRLALGAPRCRLILTSRGRVSFDGFALALEGLAREHAATIAEQDLGRPLSGSERAAAEAVGSALRGHPLQLRQTFSRVREQGLALESLAPRAAAAFERAQELGPAERDVARVLAVHGSAPLGLEHIEALAGGPAARGAAEQLTARHDARSHSPRYSLLGGLEDAFDDDDLNHEIDRALDYFIRWAAAEATTGRHDRVLAEASALLELLQRANRIGRHAEVVRLGLAIEWPLAWGNRWSGWERALQLVLSSARATGNRWAEGWALHELATRQYGIGNARAAVSGLQQALALRERIGDEPGAQATRQNLRVAGGPAPLLQRLSHLSMVVVAVIAVLLVGAGGVAGAQILGGEDADTGDTGLVIRVEGEGTVSSAGGSIRCAETECREELDAGTEVLLRAQARDGSQFSRWTGACSGRGACRLTVTDTTTVGALFSAVPDGRSVTVKVEGEGTVVSYPAGISCGAGKRCDATFKRSVDLVLSAAAAPRHRFADWSGDCAGSDRCRVERGTSPASAVARFVADAGAPRLSVSVEGDGSGRVVSRQSGIDCGEQCAASFKRGTQVVLVPVAVPGSHFAGWSERACDESCTVTLDRDREVVARFKAGEPPPLVEHELRVAVRGGDVGTVSSDPAGINECSSLCAESLPEGEVVLTTNAAEGSRVTWGAACAGTEGDTCRVTLDRALRVFASFSRALTKYTLTTSVSGDGTIDPDCSAGCQFAAGEKVTLTASGTSNTYFDRWTTGCGDPESSTCTFTMSADRTVQAEFQAGIG